MRTQGQWARKGLQALRRTHLLLCSAQSLLCPHSFALASPEWPFLQVINGKPAPDIFQVCRDLHGEVRGGMMGDRERAPVHLPCLFHRTGKPHAGSLAATARLPRSFREGQGHAAAPDHVARAHACL